MLPMTHEELLSDLVGTVSPGIVNGYFPIWYKIIDRNNYTKFRHYLNLGTQIVSDIKLSMVGSGCMIEVISNVDYRFKQTWANGEFAKILREYGFTVTSSGVVKFPSDANSESNVFLILGKIEFIQNAINALFKIVAKLEGSEIGDKVKAEMGSFFSSETLMAHESPIAKFLSEQDTIVPVRKMGSLEIPGNNIPDNPKQSIRQYLMNFICHSWQLNDEESVDSAPVLPSETPGLKKP